MGCSRARRSDEQAFVVPAHAQTNHLPLAAILLLVDVGHAMRLQVVPNKLTNDLRRRQILRRTKLLKCFFLDGINEHS